MEKLIENKDEKSGKCYILYKGVKYWLWSKRGFYVSQIGGKQTMLHRVLYGDGNQENEVYPIDGNFRNLSRNNWKIRKRGAYHYKTDREYKEFDDKKFYKKKMDIGGAKHTAQCTDIFGNIIMGAYQKAIKFITKTAIKIITLLLIYVLCLLANILKCMQK